MPATSASYARLAAVLPGLRVAAGPPRSGAGWVGAEELAGGGPAVDAYLAWDADRVSRDHGRAPRPDVAAALGLHRYAWRACLLFTVPWFLHRRVPRLPVADVSFHRADGRMTVRTRSFSCLPDDPAAGLPGARPVPTQAALREELRTALAEHLTPLLHAFEPRLRRGRHALWGLATDEITEGLWYAGRLLGEEERAVADLAALLPGGTAPYTGGASFRAVRGQGCDRPSNCRDRLTCCLFYTVAPGGACAGCPRARQRDTGRRRAAQLGEPVPSG